MHFLMTNDSSIYSYYPFHLKRYIEILFRDFKNSLEVCRYSAIMKLANLTSFHKKGNNFEKSNYRPISIMLNSSKIFERCLYKQIPNFFEDIFSKHQHGFWKGHDTHHCLVTLLEK